MRYIFSVGFLLLCFLGHAKEWKSINAFEKVNGKSDLSASDWLKSDRKHNTQVWQNANIYNLQHNYFSEYKTIKERRDFYVWYFTTMEERGCEVVWPKMAYFISNKLRLINAFPFCIFTTKSVKSYAYQGSETVFNHAFETLKSLYLDEDVLKSDTALKWDEAIIHKEQYIWLKSIYEGIDEKGLRTIERMAKGKGFYKVLVPKEIRFKSDISETDNRYYYALHVLRDYCKND
ncbi:Insecticidal toxin complex protein [Tamlana sp. 2_MG-2023]|uniref:Insecticidal toxin complex protein n=1 Tax=unclassified Tamlana TaxID=2614803 RepID=UPI0026E3199D|nr:MULTISPECIES: Insecticidal toxin complex protein [unclassified Tamlana]MDO6758810.1 Insecticidal toxin complex protein [Tamlana sp. 2_MG-2023]MDO6789509.1 Insecticidal toxin complex protein [Tamlana sp. 1_MG-2023]